MLLHSLRLQSFIVTPCHPDPASQFFSTLARCILGLQHSLAQVTTVQQCMYDDHEHQLQTPHQPASAFCLQAPLVQIQLRYHLGSNLSDCLHSWGQISQTSCTIAGQMSGCTMLWKANSTLRQVARRNLNIQNPHLYTSQNP